MRHFYLRTLKAEKRSSPHITQLLPVVRNIKHKKNFAMIRPILPKAIPVMIMLVWVCRAAMVRIMKPVVQSLNIRDLA